MTEGISITAEPPARQRKRLVMPPGGWQQLPTSPEMIVRIRAMRSEGISYRAIQRATGVGSSTIFKYTRGILATEERRKRPTKDTPSMMAARERAAKSVFLAADLLCIVSDVADLSVKTIVGPRRLADHVRARQVFFWLARCFSLRSLPQIGAFCGGRDHTTVIFGVRRVDALIEASGVDVGSDPASIARAVLRLDWPDCRRRAQ